MGPVQIVLEKKLTEAYRPVRLEVINESHMHSSRLGAESHFKVQIVSEKFAGLSRVQRQREVHALLGDELKVIHALSLRLITPEEEGAAPAFVSPTCQGRKNHS